MGRPEKFRAFARSGKPLLIGVVVARMFIYETKMIID
jgi:hypothetical protein